MLEALGNVAPIIVECTLLRVCSSVYTLKYALLTVYSRNILGNVAPYLEYIISSVTSVPLRCNIGRARVSKCNTGRARVLVVAQVELEF